MVAVSFGGESNWQLVIEEDFGVSGSPRLSCELALEDIWKRERGGERAKEECFSQMQRL